MTPSTMLPRSRPSLARPLKLATPCCPTASPLLGTRLVAILLPATDAHQHEDQSFWDDIEEEPRSLDPLGLQQYDRINSINNQLSREDTSRYQGINLGFKSTTGRDVALVNKSYDFVKDKYSMPPVWWQDMNKGLVRGSDGLWRQPKHPRHVDHLEDIDQYLNQLGLVPSQS
ncbi:hypothetical protein HN51_004346 [Arachis hypogaea]